MKLEQVWTDVLGCPRALWVGATGGHRWLVACAPGDVDEVSRTLVEERFKGQVFLIVLPVVRADAPPVLLAVREIEPRAVALVDSSTRLADVLGAWWATTPHSLVPASA